MGNFNMTKMIVQSLLAFDTRLFLLATNRTDKKMSRFFYSSLSRLGNGHIYFLVFTTYLYLGGKDGQQLFLTALVAFLFELPLYLLIKKSVKRLRPFNKLPEIPYLLRPPDEYSFPSGHTAAAFLTARLISMPLPHLAVPLYLLAALIGYSRIYLRVHYPYDVFFGILLGLLTANFSLALIY